MSNAKTEVANSKSTGDAGGSFWILIVLMIIAAAVIVGLRSGGSERVSEYVGRPLPPLQVAGWLNTDKPLANVDLQGKVVLVDFWATWCGPCVRGIPELVQFRNRFRNSGLVVVGMTAEDGPAVEQVKSLVASKQGMDWPIAYGARLAFDMMGIEAIPTYMLFDRSGTCVWGGHSLSGAEQAAVRALAE